MTSAIESAMSGDLPILAGAQALLQRVPVGILIRTDDRIVWVNDTLLDFLECTREAWLAEADPSASPLRALLGSGDEVWVAGRDGDRRCLKRLICDLEEPSYTACCFLDVSEQRALEQDIQTLTQRLESVETQDRETGLLNRQGVLAALERQVTRSRRYGNPLSLVRLSVEAPDGAETGAMLCEWGREIRAQLRWADEVGRVDPARFLLVLPETSEDGARHVAEQLLRSRSASASCDEGWTASVDVTEWRKGDDPRKLLGRVGIAL